MLDTPEDLTAFIAAHNMWHTVQIPTLVTAQASVAILSFGINATCNPGANNEGRITINFRKTGTPDPFITYYDSRCDCLNSAANTVIVEENNGGVVFVGLDATRQFDYRVDDVVVIGAGVTLSFFSFALLGYAK